MRVSGEREGTRPHTHRLSVLPPLPLTPRLHVMLGRAPCAIQGAVHLDALVRSLRIAAGRGFGRNILKPLCGSKGQCDLLNAPQLLRGQEQEALVP